ncbi:MAG TPA: hypothetical protein ENF99_01415 [Candidatus Aenigmarchaeota archaeon]|nr:hypothetical protein [Candidatus Aenigmarchaeota archaeon]
MHSTWVDMEIEILEEKENPFFERKEVKVNIKHLDAPTPSKEELKKELASKFSVDASLIQIDYIFTKKGIAESFAKVKVLKKKPEVKEEKKEAKEEKKQAEQEKVEAKPEEKKPEAKPEVKEKEGGEIPEAQAGEG